MSNNIFMDRNINLNKNHYGGFLKTYGINNFNVKRIYLNMG